MPTSSRFSIALILASALCATLPMQLLPLAFGQEQTVRDKNAADSEVVAAPILSYISPASVAVGSAGFTLTLSGSNFLPTSKVLWNGSPRPTQYDNSSQIEAKISAQDVVLLGRDGVLVANPGGSRSALAALAVYLPLITNDLVYDATRGVLWASVPSSAGATLGNSIVSIDPYTGVLGAALWVGSEPTQLALSTDGSTLWVAYSGSPSVRKVDLNNLVLTPVRIYFPGGWGFNSYASDLAGSPGGASTVAVSVGGLVSIYDDDVQRPNVSYAGSTSLAYGSGPGILYGYGYTNLSIYTVDNTGIVSAQSFNSGSYSNDLRYDNNRLYLTSGQILDGTNGNLLGTFAANGLVAPDSGVGRAFILNPSEFYGSDQVTAFDVNTFVPLGSFGVGAVDTSGYNSPSSLVRWGNDGLAFRSDAGVYVVRSSVVNDLSNTPADIAVATSAPDSAVTGADTVVKIRIKNLGPNAVSNASLVATFSGAPILVSATSTQGTCAVDQVVRCNLGQLGTPGTASVSVRVIPVVAGTLASVAEVTSSLPDPKASNNRANSVTSITGSGYNLVPVLSSISPQSVQLSNNGTLVLTVSGANFTPSSTVNWNGVALPTTFLNSGQLSATVAATLITQLGSARITVATGNPGGGTSADLPFTIYRSITLDANDVIFDPFTRKLYASIPSTSTQLPGNSVVPIDPITGKHGTAVFIGSEPTRMGLSDDGQYLYVVLSGANAVRRIYLPTMTPGTQFTTIGFFGSPFVASDVAVMPGNHDAIATCGYANGIQVWDVTDSGATSRTQTSGNFVYEGSVLAWGSAVDLYSNDEGLSPSTLHRFAVGNTSFAETDGTYLDTVANKITYSGGLIFADGGGVVDPSPAPPNTPQLVGKLPATGGSSIVDTTINGAFFLDQNNYNVQNRVITAADPSRYLTLGSVQLDNISGDAFDLIRWGNNGIAFRTATDYWGNGIGRIVALSGEFVLPPPPAPNPVPTASALFPNSATVQASNTWVKITGTNFVRGAVALWNNSPRTTVFDSSKQLRVAIASSDLAKPGVNKVKISNPGMGGGTSAALTFTVK